MAYHMGNAYGSFVRELNANRDRVIETGEKIVPGEKSVPWKEVSALGVQEAIPRFHDLTYRYDEFILAVEAAAMLGHTTPEPEQEKGPTKNDVTSNTNHPISSRYDRARSMIQDAKYFHCLIEQSQELIARVTYSSATLSHHLSRSCNTPNTPSHLNAQWF